MVSRRCPQASPLELRFMSSDYLSHVPADPLPRRHHLPGLAEKSVVLPSLAKLVLIASVLVIFIPMWLDLMEQLGSAQSWYTLRLSAIGGGAGVVTLLVLSLKLLKGLLDHGKGEST